MTRKQMKIGNLKKLIPDSQSKTEHTFSGGDTHGQWECSSDTKEERNAACTFDITYGYARRAERRRKNHSKEMPST